MRACWLGLGLALSTAACGDPEEGVLLRLVVEDDAVAERSAVGLELFLGREPVPGRLGALVREFDPDPAEGDVLPVALVPSDLDGFTIRLRPDQALASTFTVAIAAESDELDRSPLFAVGVTEVTFAPGELRRYDVIMREVVDGLPAPGSGDIHAAVWGTPPRAPDLPTHRCLKWQTTVDDGRRLVRADDLDCDSTLPVAGACSDPGQADPSTPDDVAPVDGDGDGFYPGGYVDPDGACVACGQAGTQPCDCDDVEPARAPGKAEVCDGVRDNDCDLATDLTLDARPLCQGPVGRCPDLAEAEIGLCDEGDGGGRECRPVDNLAAQAPCFSPAACPDATACQAPLGSATVSCRFNRGPMVGTMVCPDSYVDLTTLLLPVQVATGATCTAEIRRDNLIDWAVALVDLSGAQPVVLGTGPVTGPCDQLGMQLLTTGVMPFRPVLVVLVDGAGVHQEYTHVVTFEEQAPAPCDPAQHLSCRVP